MEFVRHTIRVASRDRSLTHRGHINPEGVCRVLLELAVDHFAESGREELIAWQLGSSEKLGQLIHDLARQGSIELSEHDHLAAFENWYDLTAAPETWKLQW